MRHHVFQRFFRTVVLFSCVGVWAVASAAFSETLDTETLERLRDTIAANTKRALPAELGKQRLAKEEVEAARAVYEASEKVLGQDISDEFRVWTLKRRAVALVMLAYEETPRFFPILSEEVEKLEAQKGCEKIARFTEEQVLLIGARLAVQPLNRADGKNVTIDAVALADWLVDYARRHPGREAEALIDNLLQMIETIPSAALKNRRLAETVPSFAAFFLESNDPVTKANGRKLQAVARRVTLPGRPMRLFGTDREGNPFDSDTLAGKVVLVQFWGSWCVPCREEYPLLIGLYERYRTRGFEIVGVNTGIKGDEKAKNVLRFLDETAFDGKKITWPNILDGIAAEKNQPTLSDYYGIANLPVLILIGRDGNVLKIDPLPSALELEIQNAVSPKMTLDDLTPEERAQAEKALKREKEELQKEIESLQK